MTIFFKSVNHRRHALLASWVARTFLQANTARMLRGIKATTVRKLLHDSIGDCHRFADCDGQTSFDREWRRCVRKLQNRHIPFGQAAKLVNLYVKAAIGQRGLLTNRQAKRIGEHAHVPIDSLVLKKLWSDFPKEMNEIKDFGIRKSIPLKRIKREGYNRIQQLLRDSAKTYGCVPLDYDFAYLDGSVNRQ